MLKNAKYPIHSNDHTMLASAFHVGRLVTWVGVFAVLGGIPKLVFLFLPAEWNTHTLAVASGGKPVLAGMRSTGHRTFCCSRQSWRPSSGRCSSTCTH